MRSPPPLDERRAIVLRSTLFLLIMGVFAIPAIGWYMAFRTLEAQEPYYDWVSHVEIGEHAADDPVVLGRRDLGHRAGINSASEIHLSIFHENGTWWLRNIAPDRRAEIHYKKDGQTREFLMRRWRISDGDQVAFGDGTFVSFAKKTSWARDFDVSVQWSGQKAATFHLKHTSGVGARLTSQSPPDIAQANGWIGPDGCAGPLALKDRLRKRLAGHLDDLSARNSSRRLVPLGGVVSCDDRLAIPGLRGGDAWVEYLEGHIYLGGRPEVFDTLSVKSSSGDLSHLNEAAWPIAGKAPALREDVGVLHRIYLGRTRYDVTQDPNANTLLFTATDRVQRFVLGEVQEDRATIGTAHLDCMLGASGDPEEPCADGFLSRSESQAERVSALRWSTQQQLSSDTADDDQVAPHVRIAMIAVVFLISLAAFHKVLTLVFRNSKNLGAYASGLKALLAMAFGTGFVALARGTSLAGGFVLIEHGLGGRVDTPQQIPLLIVGWLAASGALTMDVLKHIRLFQGGVALAISMFWLSLGAILVTGSLTLHALGLGSPNSSWDVFSDRHHLGLVLFLGVLAVFLSIDARVWQQALDRTFLSRRFWIRTLALGLLLFFLSISSFAMFAVGTEEGFLGLFQPVEINKFALLLVVGILFVQLDLAARYSRIGSTEYLLRWFLAIVIVLIVSSFNFIAVPLGLNDFSPIVVSGLTLLLVLPITMVLTSTLKSHRVADSGRHKGEPPPPRAKRRAAHPKAARWPVLKRRIAIRWWQFEAAIGRQLPTAMSLFGFTVLACAISLGIVLVWLIHEALQDPGRLMFFDQMERRVAVAFDHIRHAEWAGQLRLAWRSMGADAPPQCLWFGQQACDMLGIEDLDTGLAPLNDAAFLRVPALQDDLITAFFIGRFGVEAAQALMLIQAVFVISAMAGAFVVFRGRSGDFRDEGARLLLAIIAYGSASMFFVQWAVSWSNVLSWIPIMGQPMTFISYARSHMLGMALPCVLVIMLALRIGSPIYDRRIG